MNAGYQALLHLSRDAPRISMCIKQQRLCKRIGVISSTMSYLGNRSLSTCPVRNYEIRPAAFDNMSSSHLKDDAVSIFKGGLQAVHPRQLIGSVVKLQPCSSTLHIKNQTFKLKRNVFVVGMGNAVLGMARAVEDIIGEHLVCGVISIPYGLQEEMRKTENSDLMLDKNSKIQVYEGAKENLADAAALNASRAIYNLVNRLSDKDLLIVLCSGGGSALCPLPKTPITLDELHTVNKLLNLKGATMRELNTVLKNIEILKGGGLAMHAQPAKVVTLILSSMVGDPVDLIASGPTYLTDPAPKYSLQTLERFGIVSHIPENVTKYLESEIRRLEFNRAQEMQGVTRVTRTNGDRLWSRIQNIVVGNNSVACEGAAKKAACLGYHPIILTEIVTGEARDMGRLSANLIRFATICFDRKASQEPNAELAALEVQLVKNGLNKLSVNNIAKEVDAAHNLSQDICIIFGGDTFVDVSGSGVGGKNLELATSAAIQMHKDLGQTESMKKVKGMCVLSANSGGYDGNSSAAGAVVDQDFLESVVDTGLDMNEFLDNNDTYTFFSEANNGNNLIAKSKTGTNIMDLIVLIVQRP